MPGGSPELGKGNSGWVPSETVWKAKHGLILKWGLKTKNGLRELILEQILFLEKGRGE